VLGSEFQVEDPQRQNTDDQNCSDDSTERSTSVDWQTAECMAEGQQRRRRGRLVCSCSSGTAELFHEDTDTSVRRRRASGARHSSGDVVVQLQIYYKFQA